MTKTSTVAVIIGLIVIGGIAYALSSSDAAMKKEDGTSMIEDNGGVPGSAMTGDAVMKDASMEPKDPMMKDDAMNTDDVMMDDGADSADAAMKKGSYEAYSPDKLVLASSGDVVLFFHAPWCPICAALEKDINAHISTIPAGLTILKVDYDTATELKKKYGVTVQHTFVQIRADGSLISKWSDASTLAAVVSRVQ